MPNDIDGVALYQKVLDEVMQEGLTSSVLEMNPLFVKYAGGNEMKIPDIETEGNVDYSRTGGYGTTASTTLKYKTYTFEQERAFQIEIDRLDAEESGLDNLATLALTSQQKDHNIPEIDAYRYSKIYKEASLVGFTGVYTPAVADIFEALTTDIGTIQNKIGHNIPLMVFMSTMTGVVLDNADKIEKKLTVDAFNGNVNNKVSFLNGTPIFRIPSDRLKNAYTFNDGTSARGFTPKTGALNINWIIVARPSVTAIVKLANMKMFSPDVNQDNDSWKIQGRNLHTLFVPANKKDGIYVSLTPATNVVASALTLVTANNTITVTLTGGAFKPTVAMSDLGVAGTDATAILAGSLTRVSDTVVKITIATGNTGTNNVITVKGSAQELQATSVAVAGSTT
jgi:hypothetical protein